MLAQTHAPVPKPEPAPELLLTPTLVRFSPVEGLTYQVDTPIKWTAL